MKYKATIENHSIKGRFREIESTVEFGDRREAEDYADRMFKYFCDNGHPYCGDVYDWDDCRSAYGYVLFFTGHMHMMITIKKAD